MTGNILLHGATGYTGKLIVQAALQLGVRPILAGRNSARLRAAAVPHGLAWRAFDLADPARIDAGLQDVAVLLCAAGPFSATSRPLADACLRRRIHYLDITGEIDVFEALAARDAAARQAGVMLLPGVGFDVVPTDCLATQLQRRLPDATELKIHIQATRGVSRGTARSVLQEIAIGTRVRRAGRLITLGRPGTDRCDFGQGPRPTVQIPWGDVSTAFHSTGIPSIAVYTEDVPPINLAMRLPGPARSCLGHDVMQRLLGSLIDRQAEGPGEAARRTGRSVIVGIARNSEGQRVRCRLTTPEPYTLTALTASDIARRVALGEVRTGFQTPSLVYGADYILGFPNVTLSE